LKSASGHYPFYNEERNPPGPPAGRNPVFWRSRRSCWCRRATARELRTGPGGYDGCCPATRCRTPPRFPVFPGREPAAPGTGKPWRRWTDRVRYRATRYLPYVQYWLGWCGVWIAGAQSRLQAFLAASQTRAGAPGAAAEGAGRAGLAHPAAAAAGWSAHPGHAGSGGRAQHQSCWPIPICPRAGHRGLAGGNHRPEALPEHSRSFYRLYVAEALYGLGRREEAVAGYRAHLRGRRGGRRGLRRLFMSVRPRGPGRAAGLDAKAEEPSPAAPRSGGPVDQIRIERAAGMLELGEYFLGRTWGQPQRRSLPDTVPSTWPRSACARATLPRQPRWRIPGPQTAPGPTECCCAGGGPPAAGEPDRRRGESSSAT
jgi:hypothetical protein